MTGAILSMGALYLMKLLAEMILQWNMLVVGFIGTILGACVGLILSWWNNQRPRRR